MDTGEISSISEGSHADTVSIPLPDSPDGSLVQMMPATADVAAVATGLSDAELLHLHNAESAQVDAPTHILSSTTQSPERRRAVSIEAKPMSPEKAALAAMFDSIKMPPPTSPSKSPRKASGSSILSSPSKQLAREAALTTSSLFPKASSPSNSPSKVGSSDSAASRHFSRDSPMRKPVIISSSSSPGKALRAAEAESKNASTPLSPAPTSSGSGPTRMRPSMLASSSSPSAKLSDLTLNLDTTGTQELLFNQDASFLAAANNTAADVTIDDSFDVSRAKALIKSSSVLSSVSTTRRSSPAKFGGYKAKPRCSMVPEDDVAEVKPSTPGRRSNALGLRGLGIGKVVKNAAGDDTIELNLTGSFIGNSSIIGGNLMDESGEASLLFGNNSFSISQSKSPKKDLERKPKQGRKGSSDDDDDDEEEEEDFERDAKHMQKWATEATRKAQLGRQVADKTPSRPVVSARTGISTVTRPSVASTTTTKPVSRIAPRSSLVTPTPGSRLLQPRPSAASTAKPVSTLSRSSSASSGLSTAAPPSSSQLSSGEPGTEAKTPMRSRRKSTFTSTRPPVSGPARRRESLAASAVVQAHPIPPLPSLGPATPGRTRTASTPSTTAGTSPSLKTPTAASRTIPKPRASLTGRTGGVLATPRASAPASAASVGSIPRPRASLTSSAAPSATSTRVSTTVSTSLTRTPSARTATSRSASLATPTGRAATSRSSAMPTDATPIAGGMRKSASQPHGLDTSNADAGETPAARPRTLVPRASMSRIGGASRTSAMVTPRVSTAAAARMAAADSRKEAFAEMPVANGASTPKLPGGAASKIGTPATRRPSNAARSSGIGAAGGFGFKPRTSAVYIGPARTSLQDSEDKEN